MITLYLIFKLTGFVIRLWIPVVKQSTQYKIMIRKNSLLDSSINEDDMITLIGQNVSDTNKIYGEGKLYDAIKAITYSNGLAVNYDSEDTLKIIYVSIESPNSETLCDISIGETVDKVTEEMNNLDAKVIEEEPPLERA